MQELYLYGLPCSVVLIYRYVMSVTSLLERMHTSISLKMASIFFGESSKFVFCVTNNAAGQHNLLLVN